MGVTIFFVLSGYLITSLLLIEWDNTSTINLPQFWLRRVRRLFPAIVLVILVIGVLCIIFNHALFTKLREDMWAALCWVTNWWYIVRDVSYFDALGAPSPLTHFWSLAIEEQFYLVWPVLMFLAHALGVKRSHMRNATLVLCVASGLAMAIMYDPLADPSRVYYGTDTRAFSLLMGAALAFVWPAVDIAKNVEAGGDVPLPVLPGVLGQLQQQIGSKNLVDFTGIAALLGLVAMVVFCDGTGAFMYRGGLFLASILSAVVIAALVCPGGILAQLASFAPFVWVGVRSYGIYLWHYPILLLVSPYNTPAAAPWWLDIIALAAITAISAASYTFVENPIRHKAIGNFIAQVRQGATDLATWARERRIQLGAAGAALLVFIVGFFAVPYTSAIEGADLLRDNNAQVGGVNTEALGGAEGSEGSEGDSGGQATTQPTTDENNMLQYDANHLSVLWVGDSVSVRSLPYFAEAFPRGTIDAQVNRQYTEGIEVYRSYSDQGVVGSVVVLALGTNGTVDDEMIDQIMDLIGPQRHVIMINNAAPEAWITTNNQVIANAAARYSNVTVIDWYSLSASGIYFDGDGTHLNEEGAQYYVQLVADVINANGWLPAEANEPLPGSEGESGEGAGSDGESGDSENGEDGGDDSVAEGDEGESADATEAAEGSETSDATDESNSESAES